MLYRIEKDTMGAVEVPIDAYYGAQTQRSILNFKIANATERMPIELIHAYAILKKASAWSNVELGVLTNDKAVLIERVCNEILAGELNDSFPLVVWQTGSGTQTNMNLNEVIANRAHVLHGGLLTDEIKILHANDEVNKSQASNDTFPTAMYIAAYLKLVQNTLPALKSLWTTLREKAVSFQHIIKIGRTHFMDATPLTLGQVFSGYAGQLAYGIEALEAVLPQLTELAIGGTAVGTGLNAPVGFGKLTAQKVSNFTGYTFVSANNKFAALAGHEPLVNAHGAMKTIATSLMKIANDVRMLSSGPRAGIGEIFIPDNEPGSSIMPGKVNPTQCEALTMIAAQIMGNDVAINIGAANGHFELNVFKPLLIKNFLHSANLLADGVNSFNEHCAVGIQPNMDVIKNNLDRSLMLVTALNPHIGYYNAAKIAQLAFHHNLSLKEAALKQPLEGLAFQYITEEQFDAWVYPSNMI